MTNHILVTGANGFLGQRLCKALESRCHKVTRVVRYVNAEFHNQVVLDLTDREATAEIILELNPEYVIHLAAFKGRDIKDVSFRQSIDINLAMSSNLIEACLDLKNLNRFVYIGSCDEYGAGTSPFDEGSQERPSNYYGLSKLFVTKLIGALHQSRGFPGVVLRPSVIYGPNQGSEMFLSALIGTLLSKNEFAMTYGAQIRDFVYVDDVVEAVISSLSASPKVNGALINIGSGVSYSVGEVAKIVAESIGPESFNLLKFGAIPYRSNESMDYRLNIGHAKELLGWEPNTKLVHGLNLTVNQFRSNLDLI